MNEDTTVSERNAMMQRREDFMEGARFVEAKHRAALTCRHDENLISARAEAKRLYPLPPKIVPRVRDDPEPGFDQIWRYVNGCLEWRVPEGKVCGSLGWQRLSHLATPTPPAVTQITPARLALWADLAANPTEEVVSDE